MRDVVMASLFIAIKLDDCNFIINLRQIENYRYSNYI